MAGGGWVVRPRFVRPAVVFLDGGESPGGIQRIRCTTSPTAKLITRHARTARASTSLERPEPPCDPCAHVLEIRGAVHDGGEQRVDVYRLRVEHEPELVGLRVGD